ncbi:hypothetical protein CLIB1423_09S00782 [[Candida] railenensis]|uniref:Uncharacterized protein n=1 Tax=[Candida] railenensis TaxID=45579 RepID=A0A9P0QQD2_9ASCO|nr:hypothetical protein CLIB1423_09S00782 [[Candida] railenensis]
MSPETPIKRKRGRPPKAGSLSNQITSTMNINVNTSSTLSSPTAELNSRMMVKRGFAPDILNPSMIVSPSPRPRKKSRKGSTSSSQHSDYSPHSTSSSIPLGFNVQQQQKQFQQQQQLQNQQLQASSNYNNFVITNTPLSQAINGMAFTPYNQINSKTMDNISMITQDANFGPSNGMNNIHLPVYNTPPSSASSIKSQFQTNYWNSPSFLNQTPARAGVPTANSLPTPTPSLVKSNSVSNASVNKDSPSNKNLLPAAAIVRKEQEKKDSSLENSSQRQEHMQQQQQQQPQQEQQQEDYLLHSNDFILKLMVDESGKAILSDDYFSNQKENENIYAKKDNDDQIIFKPRLGHANSVIGIEQYPDQSQESDQQHRSKSDDNPALSKSKSVSTLSCVAESSTPSEPALVPPTTPKLKDNYLLSASTGFTPNINLAYNLTPHFNSLMYSMMNNSPQAFAQHQRNKSINAAQLFKSDGQDFFTGSATSNGAKKENSQENLDASSDSDEDTSKTVNLCDLMNLNGGGANKVIIPNTSSAIQSTTLTQACSTSTSSSSSVNSSAVSSTFPPLSFNTNSSGFVNDAMFDDPGDARLALRKIIHVKRERN